MRNKKRARRTVAVVVALSLILAGTYAWRSFDQIATNKSEGGYEYPGGRLHDDFNGADKHVYVENYASAADSALPFFARVRMDEYMEVGSGAGEGGSGVEVLRGDLRQVVEYKGQQIEGSEPYYGEDGIMYIELRPDIDDVTTWDTFQFKTDDYVGADQLGIYSYRAYNWGGQTTYMPTFNKDDTSLESELNGTLEGMDEEPFADFIDYTEYENRTKEDWAYYHYDPNTYEEVSGAIIEEDKKQYKVWEEHQVQNTLETEEVISMAEWMSRDYADQIGRYWVYDTDGWAYWAQPISGDSATGPLIQGVEQFMEPPGDWYYSVNVTAQMASVSDWGEEETAFDVASGMYLDGITDDAVQLLKTISRLLQVQGLQIINQDGSTLESTHLLVEATQTRVFDLHMVVTAPTEEEKETEVIWTCEEISGESGLSATEINGRITNGVLKPTIDMTGCRYRVTATSTFDSAKTDSFEFTVIYGADISVKVRNDWDIVQPGERAQMVCLIKETEYEELEWSISGQQHEDTYINSRTGVLEVSPLEPVDTTLTVHAVSYTNDLIDHTMDLPVCYLANDYAEALLAVEVGSNDKIEIDGLSYYKIKEGEVNGRNAVLLYATDVFTTNVQYNLRAFSVWESCNARIALQSWIATTTTLKTQAAHAEIITTSSFRTEKTIDQAFLLSEEEINEYLTDKTILADTNNRYFFTRTPTTRFSVLRYRTYTNGTVRTYSTNANSSSRLRPAVWVYM